MSRFLFSLVVSLATSGCSLAGMAVGDMTPRYETTSPAAVVKGDEIRVHTSAIAQEASTDFTQPPPAHRVDWVDGRYGGVERGRLVVETPEGPRTFATSSVREIAIRRGTEWRTGLIAGAVADVLVVTLLVVAAASADYRPNLAAR